MEVADLDGQQLGSKQLGEEQNYCNEEREVEAACVDDAQLHHDVQERVEEQAQVVDVSVLLIAERIPSINL